SPGIPADLPVSVLHHGAALPLEAENRPRGQSDIASDLRDLTASTACVLHWCCHPSPGGGTYPGGHQLPATGTAASFVGGLVDGALRYAELAREHSDHGTFGQFAVHREH